MAGKLAGQVTGNCTRYQAGSESLRRYDGVGWLGCELLEKRKENARPLVVMEVSFRYIYIALPAAFSAIEPWTTVGYVTLSK